MVISYSNRHRDRRKHGARIYAVRSGLVRLERPKVQNGNHRDSELKHTRE